MVGVIISILISFSFLALATFGVVLIYKTSSTTNFAQGSLGILGAYATSYFIDRQGVLDVTGSTSVTINNPAQLILPMLGGILISFAVGFLINTVIFRNAKFTNAVTKQIISMGLVIVISGLIPTIFGTVTRRSFMFSEKTIGIFGQSFPLHWLVTLLFSLVVMTTIFVLLKTTKWGLGVRSRMGHSSNL